MKTAQEFVDALKSDEQYGQKLQKRIQEKCEADGISISDAIIAVAAEEGYEVTAEQMKGFNNPQDEILDEEELGKVAGGGCFNDYQFASEHGMCPDKKGIK